MAAEAAPARLRPAWRHPRSRRRRPVRGVAFRKGVILWACKEAQDAQDETAPIGFESGPTVEGLAPALAAAATRARRPAFPMLMVAPAFPIPTVPRH